MLFRVSFPKCSCHLAGSLSSRTSTHATRSCPGNAPQGGHTKECQAFLAVAPTVWNQFSGKLYLDPSLSAFKRLLRTVLFRDAFDNILIWFFFTIAHHYKKLCFQVLSFKCLSSSFWLFCTIVFLLLFASLIMHCTNGAVYKQTDR